MKHLFLLVPSRGGSNLLFDILCTSPNVQRMYLDEGEKYFADMPTYLNAWAPVSCVHGFASRNISFYRSNDRYDWTTIKKVWNRAWGDTKPIRIEKSPPNIFRYDMLAEQFPDSVFIGMIRNPYAQIEAWVRHFGAGKRGNSLHDYYVDWVRHAEWLMRAKRDLKDNLLIINYENLIHSTEETLRKILTFFPLLHSLKLPYKLIDQNEKSLSTYTYVDINHINDAILDRTMFTIERIKMERSLGILEYFGYDIWREASLGDTICRLFWSEKYCPLIKNEDFVEYFKIMNDGLIHDEIPSWMEFFNLACRHYIPMFYRRMYLL